MPLQDPIQQQTLQQRQIIPQQTQQIVPQQQEIQQFKLPQQSPEQRQPPGYKFTTPAVPNIKFTSQVPHMMHPIHSAHSQYNTSHSFSVSFFKFSYFLSTNKIFSSN